MSSVKGIVSSFGQLYFLHKLEEEMDTPLRSVCLFLPFAFVRIKHETYMELMRGDSWKSLSILHAWQVHAIQGCI